MAYVRTRTIKAGTVSTALVEAYRDEQGRPRQRLLANLHGEPDVLTALAKLAARREALRKEKQTLAAEAVDANKFYEVVTQKTLDGYQWADAERTEINHLMAQRNRLLRRMAKIEADLATIQKDGAAIKKHCTATANDLQAAIRAFKQRYRDAEALVLGTEFSQRNAKAKFRRLYS
jgi:hypothetical protein